jgi:hypothetical protein
MVSQRPAKASPGESRTAGSSPALSARRYGLKVQIGRTTITPRRCHPARWWEQSLMAPRLYGFGIWITYDAWPFTPTQHEETP